MTRPADGKEVPIMLDNPHSFNAKKSMRTIIFLVIIQSKYILLLQMWRVGSTFHNTIPSLTLFLVVSY